MGLADQTAPARLAAISLAALLTVVQPAGLVLAEQAADTPTDRAAAESRLLQVNAEIGRLKDRLESTRTVHRREQDRLKELDLQIQQANLDLRALRGEKINHQHALESMQLEREAYLARLDERMDQLADQLRWSYRSSSQSKLQLVLNQDDPVRLARMLAYYDYYVRAQTERISLLHETLKTLQLMQQSIDLQLARVGQLADQQQALLGQLGEQRESRQAMLAQLASQIGSEAAQLQELERNRQDLEALIERLSDVLADIPADLGDHVGVEKQKGRLPMPLAGPVRHAYGQDRTGGLSWQGWLIGAAPGAEVSAIAYGRVAFADWLRGYGLLIIIDHGQGFMSLYGNNESLLREVGAWVEPGDAISLVGSNPAGGQGLYFELRRGGKAVDPAAWLAR